MLLDLAANLTSRVVIVPRYITKGGDKSSAQQSHLPSRPPRATHRISLFLVQYLLFLRRCNELYPSQSPPLSLSLLNHLTFYSSRNLVRTYSLRAHALFKSIVLHRRRDVRDGVQGVVVPP
jgi:hypothetical protein